MTFIEKISAEYDAEVMRLERQLALTQAHRAAWYSAIGAPEPTTPQKPRTRSRKPRPVVGSKPRPEARQTERVRLRVGTVAARQRERAAALSGDVVPVDRVET